MTKARTSRTFCTLGVVFSAFLGFSFQAAAF